MFLHGHTHQFREQRLGQTADLWMRLHQRSERAPIPANRERLLPCLSFHQTAQFIEYLGRCLKSHAQLSRRELPLCRYLPTELTQERFSRAYNAG